MMHLVAVQTIQKPAEQKTAIGSVPIIGGAAMVTITRGWFQCGSCGLIGGLEPMASPMMPPPCRQGCDDETEQ